MYTKYYAYKIHIPQKHKFILARIKLKYNIFFITNVTVKWSVYGFTLVACVLA